jgi:hypothetical protein
MPAPFPLVWTFLRFSALACQLSMLSLALKAPASGVGHPLRRAIVCRSR